MSGNIGNNIMVDVIISGLSCRILVSTLVCVDGRVANQMKRGGALNVKKMATCQVNSTIL